MSPILLVVLVLGGGIAMPSASAAESYNFVTKWGEKGSGDGHFLNPNGVAVDSSGNVYVADMLNNGVQKVSPEGGG